MNEGSLADRPSIPTLANMLNNSIFLTSNTNIRQDGKIHSYCGLKLVDIPAGDAGVDVVYHNLGPPSHQCSMCNATMWNRMSTFMSKETPETVDKNIVANLIQMLDQTSAMAKSFRMAKEWCRSYNDANFGLRLLSERTATRQYHRQSQGTTLLRGGRLFQQNLVDAFTAIEEQRLNWTRNNQDTLCVDLYHNLCDVVTRGDTSAAGLGKRIVLPRTYVGSPRYMMHNYQDAMALYQTYELSAAKQKLMLLDSADEGRLMLLSKFRFRLNSKKTQSFLLVVLDLIQEPFGELFLRRLLFYTKLTLFVSMDLLSPQEVILNGDSPVPTRVVEDKHQLKFNSHKDAKTLMEAIKKRFRGNTEIKKVQKTLLKQQFKNFIGSSSKGLDQIHDRLQKLKTHTLIWRNKSDLEEQSLDDLFNSLKIYETKVKLSSSTGTASQNLAFVSSSHTKSTTDSVSAATSVSAGCAKLPASPLLNVNSLRREILLGSVGIPRIQEGSYDWSYQAEEEPANYALMDFSSSSSSSDTTLIETTIPAATPAPASPKSNSSGKRRNRKACFVCKSVDHLIKDCDYHTKKMAQPTLRNYAHRATHKQPVSAAMPKITVTRPRYAHQVVTKSKSPIRSHITHSPSSKTSNSPPRVTAIQAPVVNAAQGNMSYLSDFKELNEGYVSFGGNPKGGKITGKGKIKTGKLDFDDVYFVKELRFNLFSVLQMCDKKNSFLFTDTVCLVLSPDFKLPDECQVLLRVPRENNMLHMDLFGPTFVKSLNKKNYCLVITNDYSRFTWMFFLATKDETSPILKTFITGLENQLSLKVKVIRSDNGIEFTNNDLNQFCGLKGIKREFSVPRTSQQNGIAERKNRTLIEAARTMLADSLLPIPFWAEAVNTACYVQNWVLVTKPHNKTPYELFHGRTPSIGFMRPLGYLVTILNTLDPLGSGPTWFDIDSLTKTMNYQPVTQCSIKEKDDNTKKEAKGKSPIEGYRDLNAEFKDCSDNSSNEVNAAGFIVPTVRQNTLNNTNTFSVARPLNTVVSLTYGKSSFINASQLPDDLDMPELEDITYSDDEDVVGAEADFNNLESSISVSPISTTRIHKDNPVSQIIGDLSSTNQTRSMTRVEPKRVHQALKDPSWIEAMQEELLQFKMNKKDVRGITIKNKARLVAQGHTSEEGIDYKEVFAPVARIEAIRLFLAYASFIGFMVYQMNVKSAFLYGTIEEEVYVCQPPGFEDLY
uniref:Integrase catalytic domain-containing protein n=1 Tax=Tanacetum cinerariifolium TaxID=118510 RepID=A0A6L2MKL7_TANCI|nr:hypothetical protein [Tanacetum cinerariifolium]